MKDIDHLALPSYAHIPGQNDRPADKVLESVVALASPDTLDTGASNNIAWRYGVKMINTGFYWEAHEVLEAVWMNAQRNSRELHLVQGVIHIANSALKVRMDRLRAAARLSEMAASSISRSFEQRDTALMGLTKGHALSAARVANDHLILRTGVHLPLQFSK